MGISKKTREHLEEVRAEAEAGTAEYRHANQALQSLEVLAENDEG